VMVKRKARRGATARRDFWVARIIRSAVALGLFDSKRLGLAEPLG
jgi:hypothetical protein